MTTFKSLYFIWQTLKKNGFQNLHFDLYVKFYKRFINQLMYGQTFLVKNLLDANFKHLILVIIFTFTFQLFLLLVEIEVILCII